MTLNSVQQSIFDYIKNHIQMNGYAPTYREIADGTHASTACIHDHLPILAAKGYIRYSERIARSIRLEEGVIDAERITVLETRVAQLTGALQQIRRARTLTAIDEIAEKALKGEGE